MRYYTCIHLFLSTHEITITTVNTCYVIGFSSFDDPFDFIYGTVDAYKCEWQRHPELVLNSLA